MLIKKKIKASLSQTFRPEFLNRIDEIIIFDSLNHEQLVKITDLMLNDTKLALKNKNMTLDITDEAKDYIISKGTDIKFGARPLRRAIQRYVEDEISDMILKSEVLSGQTIKVTVSNDNLKFDKRILKGSISLKEIIIKIRNQNNQKRA